MRISAKALAGRWLTLSVLLGAACGGAPTPPAEGGEETKPQVVRRRQDLPDDCAQVAGQPPPEPLARVYEGVAAKARCQREVFSIMGGVTHFLGVKCEYCHVKDDYPAPTHRKSVANWMARELIPTLEKEGGGEVWCNDCHLQGGKGTAKILGNPRQQAWAIEWMTAHLAEDFQRASDHGPLRCKDCHGDNLGSPGFERKIILTDNLPPKPAAGESAAPDASAPAPQPDFASPPSPSVK